MRWWNKPMTWIRNSGGRVPIPQPPSPSPSPPPPPAPATSLAGLFTTTVASDAKDSVQGWFGADLGLVKSSDGSLWTWYCSTATSYVVMRKPLGGSGTWSTVSASGVIPAPGGTTGEATLLYDSANDLVHFVYLTTSSPSVLRIKTWNATTGTLAATSDYPDSSNTGSNPTYNTGSGYMRAGIDPSSGQICVVFPRCPGFPTANTVPVVFVGAKWNGTAVAYDTLIVTSSVYHRMAYGFIHVSGRDVTVLCSVDVDLNEIDSTTWPNVNSFAFSLPQMLKINLDTQVYSRTPVGTQYSFYSYPTYRMNTCVKTNDGRFLMAFLRNATYTGSGSNNFFFLAVDSNGNTLTEVDITANTATSGFFTLVETADLLVNLLISPYNTAGLWVSKVTHSGTAYTVAAADTTTLSSFWGNMANHGKLVTTAKHSGSAALTSTVPFIFDRGTDYPSASYTDPVRWQFAEITIDEH